MKVNYDRQSDSLSLVLRSGAVHEQDKIGPGILADFAADGALVGLQIRNASTRMDGKWIHLAGQLGRQNFSTAGGIEL